MSHDLIEPTQKGSRLRRVTFWVTIIAVLSSLVFAYIAAIFGPTPYPYDPTGYLIYLVVLSCFFISLISYHWAISWDTDYWDKYSSWMVYFLPPWILCFVSGLLRIMVWWKEKTK